MLERVGTASVRSAFAAICYLIEDAFAAMMTPGFENRKRYGENRMDAVMPAPTDNAVSEDLNAAQFKVRLQQTIEKIVSSLQYLFNVIEEVLETQSYIKPVANVVKTWAHIIMGSTSKRK